MKAKLGIVSVPDTPLYVIDSTNTTKLLIDSDARCDVEFDCDNPVIVCSDSVLDKWKWYLWVFYVIFLPIIGVFNCIIAYGAKWYDHACPYILKCKILPKDGKTTMIDYKNGSYDVKRHTFSRPVIKVDENAEINDVEFTLNENNITLAFISFVRRIVSVLGLLVIVLIAVILFAKANTIGVIVAAVVTVILFTVCILICAFNYKQYKASKELFETISHE